MTHGSRRHGPAHLLLAAGFLLPLAWSSHFHPPADGDETGTPFPNETPTPPPTDTVTVPPTPSDTLLPSPTSDTPTLTVQTPSPTASMAATPTPYPPQALLINEVAWAGTIASSSDEWIELYNTTAWPIDLTGWTLTDHGDIRIRLRGTLPAHAFFLLERTNDSTVSNIPADQIYTGSLRDSGEALWLLDPSGSVVDSANAPGASWPAGGGAPKATMQRLGRDDVPASWCALNGPGGLGLDAKGNPIAGTPRGPNACTLPATATPPPTPIAPLAVLINEVAWAGTIASSSDEWIELYNTTDWPIDLTGWTLTDHDDIRIRLRGTLPGHAFFLLERTDDSTISNIPADQIYTGSLRDSGEALWLLDPSGSVVDSANAPGASWPAGGGGPKATMQRLGRDDVPASWCALSGPGGLGLDAKGNPIAGTPRGPNACTLPATATPPPTPIAPLAVLINEVAWAGTIASSSDEWIELYNTTAWPIDLTGWTLTDEGDVRLNLRGAIPPHGFFVIERGDDTTIADVPADQIYTGSLRDSGETLWLRDSSGTIVDTANQQGRGWPAGSASTRASMERRGGDDRPGNWGTFTGYHGQGRDAAGNPIAGTPRATNSLFLPTPVPTWIPGRVVINEVLIRPRYDWEGTGGVSTGDEFIELYNLGPFPVHVRGWLLDDIAGGGSKPYALPGVTIDPFQFAVFFRSRTRISLNDAGDTVRLLSPDGQILDEIRYLRVRAYNLSYGRLPDGSRHLRYGLWPTPGRPNILFVEPLPTAERIHSVLCPRGGVPEPRLPRQARHPAVARWMAALGYLVCRPTVP